MRSYFKCFYPILGTTVLTLAFSVACSTYYFRKQYENVNSLLYQKDSLQKNSFLKAHYKNGDIFILEEDWIYDSSDQYISGKGTQYDFNRKIVATGVLRLVIDSVAIFETNKRPKERIAALAVVTVLDALIAIPCLLIPKACFGSCPTIYLNDESVSSVPDAEAFSNAICPQLEYGDVDALGSYTASSTEVSITVKNEALETHCINQMQLLAYPVHSNESVYQTGSDKFFRCQGSVPPQYATGPEGEITHLVNKADRQERFSLASDQDLATKEEIYLNYYLDKPISNPALLIHFRQTLMTTYLIYSALSYMGDQAGEILASIEKGDISSHEIEKGIYKALGDIEVFAFNEKKKEYQYQGKVYETGPIAINKELIPLVAEEKATRLNIKLVMNRGLWRIDYAALTNRVDQVKPEPISPYKISVPGMTKNQALSSLSDDTKHWVTLPGSEYTLVFELPFAKQNYDLFIYSKGYYLEWMRHSWLKDKNLLKLKQVIENPSQYLKGITKEYKSYEAEMEREFWNSKINKNSFSHEAN